MKSLADIEKEYEGKFEKTDSGMKYVVLQSGQGDTPKQGTSVLAHYTGALEDGNVFDSSVEREEPFQFQVGLQEVIPGWDEAFSTMTTGEKRIIILPPELAYGKQGIGPIPPNATLVFEVELLGF